MAQKKNVETKASLRSRTPRMLRHTQEPDFIMALKHHKLKADKVTRNKQAIMILKSNLRLNRIREDTDRKLQGKALSSQQHMLSLPSTRTLEYYSPDNVLATALERTALDNKGKRRVDPKKSTSHDLSMYQPSYQEDPMSDQCQLINASTSSLVQNPPPNMSRDHPSGGFFEGPIDKVDIKGGTMNHTLGHHMNFTIQVNPPREKQYDTCAPATPTSTPFIGAIANNIVSPSMQPIHNDQFPSVAASEQSASMLTTIYAPDNGNKIYERHLGLAKRGFPLWIPEPNRNLPMPYRRKGVNIGDVGIITSTGGFSFLFNICLPHDNPINPRTLPDGFAPIYPPIEPMDVREYLEFKPESYLASTAIEKIHNDPPIPGLSFATSAAEGAVLTLPDGAISRDLENIPRFRTYAAANIESWYRYVNGPRGREAKNGEVRLVTGCDKATSWGMAAVANMPQHKTHYLKYRPVSNGGATSTPIPLYKWEYTGLAQARVGPDLAEIEDLKKNDGSDLTVGEKYWNQSLFIRTLNLTLDDEVFAAINKEQGSALIQESQYFENKEDSGNSANDNLQNTGTQMGGGASQKMETDSGIRTRSAKGSLRCVPENLTVDSAVRKRVTTSRSPSVPKSHPADVLNKVLLEKVPNCRVVITRDADWCSVISEDDEIMPSPSGITERVLAAHHIKEEDGVVFLEPKEEQQPALRPRQFPSNQLSKDSTDSQNRMAGISRLAVAGSSFSGYEQTINNPSSKPEMPSFIGYVETTVDALRLIHAVRQGVIPRMTRRLNSSERRTMIKSGAVFIFSIEKNGIERWTDGIPWSASRILGNFRIYREKRYEACQGMVELGELMKKTITVTTEGSNLHLISYYIPEDIRSGKLKRPTTRADIMTLYMPPHIFALTTLRVPPKVEISPDGKSRLVEAEDIDSVDCEVRVKDHSYNIPGSPLQHQDEYQDLDWDSTSASILPPSIRKYFAAKSVDSRTFPFQSVTTKRLP